MNIKDNLQGFDLEKITSEGKRCPHLAAEKTGSGVDLISGNGYPRLLQLSAINDYCDDSKPMSDIRNWVHQYLARPHPELGRKGPVCPFVSLSIKLDSIWITQVAESDLTEDRIQEIINYYRDAFFSTEPTSDQHKMNKAFIVLFPTLEKCGAAVIDRIQSKLKKHFVESGLMLGEFHEENQSPGLRNPEFRPLRSPIPMLAIRHMVDTDLPFLLPDNYPAEERSLYLRSYLTYLSRTLSSANLNLAIQALVNAEVETAINKMKVDIGSEPIRLKSQNTNYDMAKL
ncbi:MAG: hypothetical protein KJ556_17880 [Gammaproteobacteria bacterium]|nr:hypothetical protein [Gammaproteobacteria bacterium]MBU2058195.1 hypothetical protein [Gammaproteobacteria bacterium]MBU2176974.1 hypothetical protein [Gammaproteobacteria bacterium]MBU2246587.1 hypothetical protein [Gammaproteobacteria bacterium]MBU2344952.1 hypothetical protein [Gammaproteobacteria bacterium]